MTIVEFLEARLTEDEARFMAGVEADVRYGFGSGEIDRHPEILAEALADAKGVRLLREVEAKRAIVDTCYGAEPQSDAWHKAQAILRVLASVYADHPDYDQVWAGVDISSGT